LTLDVNLPGIRTQAASSTVAAATSVATRLRFVISARKLEAVFIVMAITPH
jgi:hypothetical protein